MYKSHFVTLFLFVLLLAGITSCFDENSTFGERLVNTAFRNVKIDTLTVKVSVMKMDSLETNGTNQLLLGYYEHELWGNVTASSFISFNRPNYTTTLESEVQFDSLTLRLRYGSYYIGDTIPEFKFDVYRVVAPIELNDNGYLYNTSWFELEDTMIASYHFFPRPNLKEEYEVRLPDHLGSDLLARLHDRDNSVNSANFEFYFPGVAILPDDVSSVQTFQIGGDSLTALVLYYTILGDENQKKLVIQPNTTKQFNHIEYDLTDTDLNGVNFQDEADYPSELLDNRGVLFGGIGLYSKLEFPYLNNLMLYGERVDIESAYLQIYPERGTYDDFNVLPDSLYLYIVDENNTVTNAVMDYLGNQVQNATLVQNEMLSDGTYYYFDITDFLVQELGTYGRYKHSLQLVFAGTTYTNTFRNLTFKNMEAEKLPLKLQLNFKIYESY